jgi:hypothetical protein
MTDPLKDARERLAGFVNAKLSSGQLRPLGLLGFGHLLGRFGLGSGFRRYRRGRSNESLDR